jgi:glycogen phosphorylase
MSKTSRMLDQTIAYFSMEIAIADEIPTFSGGLGVLAGDFLRAIADGAVPAVGVTLLYRSGYFRQTLDGSGQQVESPVAWNPADYLEHLENRVTVTISGRAVTVGVWRYVMTGITGFETPIYLLDTALPENALDDRLITDRLYDGGPKERLSQEAVLGLAGVAMLESLGHEDLTTFHMNEGHAALLPVALLRQRVGSDLSGATAEDLEAVRECCVFTTHTPVPAGHDRFTLETATTVLGGAIATGLDELGCLEDEMLNMTVLGMFFSGFINGVAKRHGEVSQAMFPQFRVESITNGVHASTWVAPEIAALFDDHLPGWREDNSLLGDADAISLEELRGAHLAAKGTLFDEVIRRNGVALDPAVLTIGIARRAAEYKRNDLIFSDLDALTKLVDRRGSLQILCSGKAHPDDVAGKALIAHITELARELSGAITVVYLTDYGMRLAARLVAGVDVWLNNPIAPREASGTSGMKAAMNGVPSLSTLDGWWLEGCVEGVTGWAIGTDRGAEADDSDAAAIDKSDSNDLRRVLGSVVMPMYYERPEAFTAVGRSAIATNGSFFTSERMLREYVERAYRRHVPIDA